MIKISNYLISLLLVLSIACVDTQNVIAQADTTKQKRVEVMPQYPGGQAALLSFIGSNVEYPKEAVENGYEGVVYIKFVVNEQGFVESPEVTRSVSPVLDSAAIAVVKKLGRFTPGMQDGVPVKVYYNLPISFKLSGHTKKQKKK